MEKLRSADWRKSVGALIMIAFGAIAMVRWQQTGLLFFLLLLFRDLIFAYFLLVRKSAQAEETVANRLLSYGSAALPLVYLNVSTSNQYFWVVASLLSIVGFLISTLATIELGNRIGIAPAKRGEVCKSGVYKYIKHPMYTGYIVAEFGNILLNPINIIIFGISTFGYYWRAKKETKIIN